jgi:ABC-type glutathione transport system ATPase component
MPSDTALLEVRDLRVRLGGRHGTVARDVLRGVDLAIAPGEIVGVIGETGSGKTTLARTILGLEAPTAGSIRFDGRELTRLGAGRRRRAFRREGHVQLVFQDPLRALDPGMRIVDIVTEGRAVRARLSPAQRRAEATRALELVGLGAELLDRVPRDISGGQRQRVAVARALVTNPRLVVLDEPVSALDASTRGALLQTLRRLRDELGPALVIISHDLTSMVGVVDRVAVLYEGAVVEQGPAAAVLADPQHEYTRLLIAAAPASVRERLRETVPSNPQEP